MVTLILFCLGIGALFVGAPLLIVALVYWWVTLPILSAALLGVPGFLVGVGLDVLILFAVALIKLFMADRDKVQARRN